MVCACIDIGSNTTRLLVAELVESDGCPDLDERLVQRAYTRIGRGLAPDRSIRPAKLAEVQDVVEAQMAAAVAAGAQTLFIVATAAVRGSPNRNDLVAAVHDATGATLRILTGDEEARLAFSGATFRLARDTAGVIGVADVGGGSTELAVGTLADGVAWSTSLPVGSGVLADAHLRHDPPMQSELAALRAHAAAAFTAVRPPLPALAVAVGGSAASLCRIVGARLDAAGMAQALDLLAASPADELARRHDLDAERVRLLPAGLAVLERASEAFGAPLEVAGGGLREGVLLEALA